MNETDAIQTIMRVNSLVSASMGVGKDGSDPLEELQIEERLIQGHQARQIRRSLDIIQRIIDSPVDAGLKGEIKIISNYDEYGIGKLALDRLKELGIRDILRESAIDSRIYTRGSIVLPVLRETGMYSRDRMKDELQKNNIERIEKINVIPEDFFSFRVQNYDPLARGFREIEAVYVQGELVHPSRFVHVIDDLDIFLLRGTPLLARIYTACKALNIAQWTITQLILRYRALVIKYPEPKAKQNTAKDWMDIKSLVDDIKRKFTSKSVAAVPSSFEFEYLQTQFQGLDQATDFLFEYLSSVSGEPQSIIKGSAQGELASAKEDKRDYYAMVEADVREKKFSKVLRYILELISFEKGTELHETFLKYGIRPGDVKYTIEYEPLSALSPLEESQKNLVDAQTASLEIDKQISSPRQMQQWLHPEREAFEGGEVVPSDPFGMDELLKKLSGVGGLN